MVGALGGSALFAARFRENAARALLLPRARGGQRRPLWQMRQRAAQLLAVASRYGSFPIVLETYRECLQDVFDVPALRELLAAIRRRDVRVHASRRGAPRRSRRRSSSATSPSTCTRATRRSWTAGRRRSPWTASCCASCSGRRSFAISSIRARSPTWSWSCRRSPPGGPPGRPTGCTTFCGVSGTCRAAEVAARVRGSDEDERAAAAGRWLAALARGAAGDPGTNRGR